VVSWAKVVLPFFEKNNFLSVLLWNVLVVVYIFSVNCFARKQLLIYDD